MNKPKHTAGPRDTRLWLEPQEVNPDLYHDFWEIPWSKAGEIAVEGVYGKANAYRIVEEHNALAGIEDVPGFMDDVKNLVDNLESWYEGETFVFSDEVEKVAKALAKLPKTPEDKRA